MTAGVYVLPTDCSDPALVVSNAHCSDANDQIGIALLAMGITEVQIDALVLPNPALLALGRALACANAALDAARGDDSAMMAKHRAYADKAHRLNSLLTRAALGISTKDGTGFGSVRINRG